MQLHSLLLLVAAVIECTTQSFALDAASNGCLREFVSQADIDSAVSVAQGLLKRFGNATEKPLNDRIAIHMLNSGGFAPPRPDEIRQNVVRCCLTLMQRRVLPYSQYDLYVWTWDGVVPMWMNGTQFQRVFVMRIPPGAWKFPCGLRSKSQWVGIKGFATDYFLMGRWRLAFAPAFSKAMGYSYFAYWDTDAIPTSDLNVDIVKTFREKNYEMGVFSGSGGVGIEKADVLIGIAEFTAFFMLTEGYTKPVGSIFKHVVPGNRSGLTSEGYDRQYYRGFFGVFSVDFWYRPIVQRFLTLVMITGKDIEMRWQEQGVINMMRLLFVPEERIFALDRGIVHHHSQSLLFNSYCRNAPLYLKFMNLTELHAGL